MGMPDGFGTGSDNICTDLGFSFQHNIQLLDDGSLLFFDNGNISMILNEDDNFPTTRIRRLRVIDNSYCETVWEYVIPEFAEYPSPLNEFITGRQNSCFKAHRYKEWKY